MTRDQLRAIAGSAAAKVPGFDQVTPVAATYPGFDFIGWFVLVAPAGTPDAIVRRRQSRTRRGAEGPRSDGAHAEGRLLQRRRRHARADACLHPRSNTTPGAGW